MTMKTMPSCCAMDTKNLLGGKKEYYRRDLDDYKQTTRRRFPDTNQIRDTISEKKTPLRRAEATPFEDER